MAEAYYPKEPNLGQKCSFWNLGGFAAECRYPKYDLLGRTTCRGTIDDVCLNTINRRPLTNPLTIILMSGFNTSVPNSSLLPPGQIE